MGCDSRALSDLRMNHSVTQHIQMAVCYPWTLEVVLQDASAVLEPTTNPAFHTGECEKTPSIFVAHLHDYDERSPSSQFLRAPFLFRYTQDKCCEVRTHVSKDPVLV